jgi:hypothetical protein
MHGLVLWTVWRVRRISWASLRNRGIYGKGGVRNGLSGRVWMILIGNACQGLGRTVLLGHADGWVLMRLRVLAVSQVLRWESGRPS